MAYGPLFPNYHVVFFTCVFRAIPYIKHPSTVVCSLAVQHPHLTEVAGRVRNGRLPRGGH